MGVPGEVGSITLTIPPYLVLVAGGGVGDAGLVAVGVVVGGAVLDGVVVAGMVVIGVVTDGCVAAGVIGVGVLVLQLDMTRRAANRTTREINNFFIPSSSFIGPVRLLRALTVAPSIYENQLRLHPICE
jgi:hypothetical protein